VAGADVTSTPAGSQPVPRDGSVNTPTLLLIQVLRAIAAFMVVAYHATTMHAERLHAGGRPWLTGAAGVDIFFVISGLVIGLSSEKLLLRRNSAAPFLARRIERVVPLYWLLTTLKILVLMVAPALAVSAIGTPWHVIASYLLLPSRNANVIEPVLVVGWTLSFEMFFYLLFALALTLKIVPWKLVSPVLAAIAVAAFFVHRPGEWPIMTLFSPMVLEFLYGVILASIFRSRRLPPPTLCWLIAAASIALLLATPWAGTTLLRAAVWGLPAAAIVWSALGLEARLRSSIPVWMLESGDASYSIYLTHGFALPLLGILLARLAMPPGMSLMLAIVLSLAASALLGDVTYRLIERPIIDYFGLRRRSVTGVTHK
jgi:exopolysaccharide production protein ExoZ